LQRDFTLSLYADLLQAFQGAGYHFLSMRDLIRSPAHGEPYIVLRHDVDLRPAHALEMARLEEIRSICATYYVRAVKATFRPDILREIESLGHEVGYHYEDLSSCQGDVDRAWESFLRNLERFREVVTVDTACMHGSPLSRFDNRALWEQHDFQEAGILGEPYFSLDYNKVAYLTDTGRRWDGDRYNIRDRTTSGSRSDFHGTRDIIRAIEEDRFPRAAVLNTHPQRWTDAVVPWTVELLSQHVKNLLKSLLLQPRWNSR